MKIAVIGAGAIGGLVGGYLKFKKEDVILVGRHKCVEAIKAHGLIISGTRGHLHIPIDVFEALTFAPDLAILAVKTQDCEEALLANRKFLKDSKIITTQNGIQADYIVAKQIPQENIISSIVMFGATYLEPGKIVHNFEGPWILGTPFGKDDVSGLRSIGTLLGKAFPIAISDDITGMKYLKIFINASNCIPAILGVSMQEAFEDLAISAISIALWKEGLHIVHKSGIKLVSLPHFPVERVTKLVAMPQAEAARIFSDMMMNLSSEPLYGSILQSIKRNRPSEVSFINGEFVALAQKHNLSSPLHKKMVDLVYRVEITKKFLTKEQLLEEIKEASA